MIVPAAFKGQIAPDPLKTYFLHSSRSNDFLDNVTPSGSEKYKDSAGINYNNGNPWKEIGTWSNSSTLSYCLLEAKGR